MTFPESQNRPCQQFLLETLSTKFPKIYKITKGISNHKKPPVAKRIILEEYQFGQSSPMYLFEKNQPINAFEIIIVFIKIETLLDFKKVSTRKYHKYIC